MDAATTLADLKVEKLQKKLVFFVTDDPEVWYMLADAI